MRGGKGKGCSITPFAHPDTGEKGKETRGKKRQKEKKKRPALSRCVMNTRKGEEGEGHTSGDGEKKRGEEKSDSLLHFFVLFATGKKKGATTVQARKRGEKRKYP